jgi:valyl-tRNA synthetase
MLEDLRIGQAAEIVHNEFWHWFCDESIEKTKTNEISFTSIEKGLKVFLKLFHPFMPFITEEINKNLFSDDDLLISTSWR